MKNATKEFTIVVEKDGREVSCMPVESNQQTTARIATNSCQNNILAEVSLFLFSFFFPFFFFFSFSQVVYWFCRWLFVDICLFCRTLDR